MTNQTEKTELSLLRRWLGFIAGGTAIVIIGFAILIVMELMGILSPLLLGVCIVAILLAVNLWGRQYGITKIAGR